MLSVRVTQMRGFAQSEIKLVIGAGITALVGPSGAGKTSLLRIIAGLDASGDSEIALNGKALNGAPELRDVGMVFQEPRLLPHLSVRQNIELRRQSERSVETIAGDLGISALLDRQPIDLSGGEKQRVMIARALFGQPKIMLFDEPLSAIDPVLKSELIALIRNHFQDAGIPVVYVTHQIEEAAQLASQLVAIDNGAIVAHGPLSDTMAQLNDDIFFENGVTSVLDGNVSGIDEKFELATISIGAQEVQLARRDLSIGDAVRLRIWARDVILASQKQTSLSARNQLQGQIESIVPFDKAQSDVLVRVEGALIRSRIMSKTAFDLDLKEGQHTFVIFKSASID